MVNDDANDQDNLLYGTNHNNLLILIVVFIYDIPFKRLSFPIVIKNNNLYNTNIYDREDLRRIMSICTSSNLQ